MIDGYYSKDLSEYSNDEATAVRLVAKSMMVTDQNQTYQYFLNSARKSGFKV